MKIEVRDLEKSWKEYTLTNDHGMQVNVLNFGGIITKMLIPDKAGNLENVVLGYADYTEYQTNPNYFGAIIGPVAGRIANSHFTLDGQEYKLENNEGAHHLHGGSTGFHQVIWDVDSFEKADAVGLVLSYTRADEEGGYPGKVDVQVTYTLHQTNQFEISYTASTDKTTPLTLTNHSYFNLSGNLRNTLHEQQVSIDSDHVVELDEKLIPTGELLSVEGTTFDFRKARALQDGFNGDTEQNRVAGKGIDHYFIFNENNKETKATAADPVSGRKMTIQTDQPGMVMYTSNNLPEGLQLQEGTSRQYLGVCFETQASPASLHHKGFPGVVLKPGEVYQTRTLFDFGVL
ncbi:Aldose 1-epimerase precursor [Oceanobacillus picturae]|uniref:Aldose 1-epimerase n=1 Tax=Oceanobacillus picturae TaxID=171693 RepID=W9BBD3_9BACI|nr:aldose epimerase family protein [Oceanobacillus picturae]CDO03725.1 Aldose 1-epimerase precursor [Oceanobacillus picturae]